MQQSLEHDQTLRVQALPLPSLEAGWDRYPFPGTAQKAAEGLALKRSQALQ